MPTLSLSAKTVPVDYTGFGSYQEMIEFVAQYLSIDGLENFTGINIGETAPTDPGDRDKPWFRTDPDTGRSLGWGWWNGSEWEQLSQFTPRGTTLPVNPVFGETFYHETIQAQVIYRGSWKLDDGAPTGTLKWVDYDPSILLGATGDFLAGTFDTVLGLNPGYEQFSAATNRVLLAAGTKPVRSSGGSETHTLTNAELPPKTVPFYEATGSGVNGISGGDNNPAVVGNVDTTGGLSTPHNNMQPYYTSWLLKKV